MTKRRTAPRKLGQSLVYHAIMLAIAGVFLLPFYWMAIAAFKTTDEIFARPVTWFPDPIHWSNVTDLLTRTDFPFWPPTVLVACAGGGAIWCSD